MADDNDMLRKHLLSYLERHAAKVGKAYTEEEKREFEFHMTDWKEDLSPLAKLYLHPESITEQEAHIAIYRVFFHILEHVLAAAEIYDDAPEIYGMLLRKREKLDAPESDERERE